MVDNKPVKGPPGFVVPHVSDVSTARSRLFEVKQSSMGYRISALADSAPCLTGIILHFFQPHAFFSPLLSVFLQPFHFFSQRSNISASGGRRTVHSVRCICVLCVIHVCFPRCPSLLSTLCAAQYSFNQNESFPLSQDTQYKASL